MTLTHHQQIARALHRATDCGYQTALQRVQNAATAGRLPAARDRAGLAEAVRLLTEDHHRPTPPAAASAPTGQRTPDPAPTSTGTATTAFEAIPVDGQPGAVSGVEIEHLMARHPDDLTDQVMRTLRAQGALRGLRQKEATVAAMRAERDARMDPRLQLPPHLARQVEHLLNQIQTGQPAHTGQTTASTDLALSLAQTGNRVLLVDLDPQQTRAPKQPAHEDYETVIVDTPPAPGRLPD